MNENKGAKGGRRDRLRTIKLTKKQKKRLQEIENARIEELERIIKKDRLRNLIIIIPAMFFGAVKESFVPDKEKEEIIIKKRIIKEIEKSSNKSIEEIIKENKNKNARTEKMNAESLEAILEKYNDNKTKKLIIEHDVKAEELLEIKLASVKSEKIVEEYEKKLKDVRYALRKIYYDANVLDELNELENDPSEKNIKKLDDLIAKLEKLKNQVKNEEEKLEIDDNYLGYLVDEDLKRLESNQEVKYLTNSALYIAISNKIKELEEKKDILEEITDVKRESRENNYEKLDNAREKDNDFDKVSRNLLKFQNDQDNIFNNLKANLVNVKSIEEKASYEIESIGKSTKLAIRRINLPMRTPGVRSAIRVNNIIGNTLYYLSNMIHPRPFARKYKKLKVSGFSKTIETSLEAINKSLGELAKTSKQLSKTLKDFESKYSEYSDTEEYKNVVAHLAKMKIDLEEKEYELQQLKKQQELRLQRENAKVKVLK